MVVCKYFLQGTCRFGAYCHYDHQVPTNYSYSNYRDNTQASTSILRQSNFGNANSTQNAKPKPATTPTPDINTLVKAVATDMMGAEKGGQWLMSSYAPFKEKPEFPGFEDQSFEEIRFGFYDAQKNGTMEQYKQQLQMLLQNAIAKVRALQNPTPDITNILQQIYNTPVANSNKTFAQSSSNQQSSNIFATQNQSTFSQQQNTNIFAAKNVFGGSETSLATNNIFASTGSSAPPNQNIFAGGGFVGTQSSSNFGAPQNTNFGNQQPTNIFATQQPTSTNIFAAPFGSPQQQPVNIFATAPQQPQNMFAAQPISAPPSVFEHQKQQNIFAAQSQPLQNAQQNIFASQMPQTQNVFATNVMVQQNATPVDYSTSIFGNTANTNQGGFGAKQEIDESLYSKLEDLNEEEKKWFESNNLDILNIPDKPPTYEMCFQV